MNTYAADNREHIRALEENLWSLWSRFGRGEGCHLYDEGGALWFDTPIPTLPYSAVLRFYVERDPDLRIDAIFDHYRKHKSPFLWVLHPTACPADLGRRLVARGLAEAEICPGMVMDLDSLPDRAVPPEGIEIREVAAKSDVIAALELVAWRWDVPREVLPKLPGVTRAFEVGRPGNAVRCWIAWKGSTPLSKVVLNLAAGAAGLYGVATRPEARGLGLARAVTLEAFHTARREGWRLGVLHSSPMAQSLYAKIGFRPVAPFHIYSPPEGFHV